MTPDPSAAEVPRRGIACYIYRWALGRCANGGISDVYDQVVLVGPGIPEETEADPAPPAVELQQSFVHGGSVIAVPLDQPADKPVGPMYGGTFIFSSNSCFPGGVPIRLHDRFETWEQYNGNFN